MEHTRAAPVFTDDMDYSRLGGLFPSLDCHARPRLPISSWADFWDCTRVRPVPAPALDHVNAGRVTDFSIQRILSPDVGTKALAEWTPNSCCAAPGTFNSYLHHAFYPSYPIVTAPHGSVCSAACISAEERRLVQQQQQQRNPRVRTVFTDGQLQRLEELFEKTRYPAPEMRAEVAWSTGLSDETVRVWFKNQRARRKRQSSSPRNSHGH